jgi:bifunctional DNase/RNase
MAEDLIEVKIVGLVPSNSGIAVFLGNGEKTFSIHVDHGVGTSIALLLKEQKRERPLTHDLIHLIFRAFNVSVERIVINDLRDDTYFARLTLKAENEVHRKITEIDARPERLRGYRPRGKEAHLRGGIRLEQRLRHFLPAGKPQARGRRIGSG